MTAVKFQYFISILLILINIVIASNSDGICTTFSETYVDGKLDELRTTTSCCSGYKEEGKYCVPRCKKGYSYNVESKNCDPVCSTPCSNGKCSKPEECDCYSGYQKNSNGICVKNECDPSKTTCHHGTCTSNGVCLCNEGFAKNYSTLARESIRTDGFEWNNSKCVPICSKGCLNGICDSPDNCICNSGYKAFNSSICNPICEESCVFGICTAPSVCDCFENYQLQNRSCNPICSSGCLNGLCVEPDVCRCHTGYKQLNVSVCSPICEDACINGACTQPNNCTCHAGYQLDDRSYNICSPVCSRDCLNGNCAAPDVCICDKGFEYNKESEECEPICYDECVNSNCTSPNNCTCTIGFSPLNSTHCEILCENCSNGYCDEPNICQCDIGYHRNIEGGICVENECSTGESEDSCENGYCSGGICECDVGYKKNESMDNENNICYSIRRNSIPYWLDDLSVRVSNFNSKYITVAGVIVAGAILLSVLSYMVYVRHYKRNSYRCRSDSKVIYYENDNDWESR